MFKKRVRLATVLFAVVVVLVAVSVGVVAVTAKQNGVETEPFVSYGNVEEINGVKLEVYTLEGIRLDDTGRVLTKEAVPAIDTFHHIRTLTMSDGLLQKGLTYEKGDGTEIVNRYFDVNAINASGYSYELTGTAYNGFYLYFDVPNFEYRTWSVKEYITYAKPVASKLHLEEGDGESRIDLSELDGGMYGYIGLNPDYEEWFSGQTVTVNKGIYRFFEDGTTEYVFPMETLAEDFSFLWMIPKEEEKTLTVVGTKENDLVAYIYSLENKTVEERVLWQSEGEVVEWYENAKFYNLADLCFDGNRVYLGYAAVATGWLQVEMSVFEDGNRVFEGELLKEEFGYHPLKNLSMQSNVENEVDSVPERIRISVKSK